MFHSFFNSLARSRYLSLFSYTFSFILWSTGTVKSTILQVLFFLLIIIRSGLLAEIRWSVCMSKSHIIIIAVIIIIINYLFYIGMCIEFKSWGYKSFYLNNKIKKNNIHTLYCSMKSASTKKCCPNIYIYIYIYREREREREKEREREREIETDRQTYVILFFSVYVLFSVKSVRVCVNSDFKLNVANFFVRNCRTCLEV